MEFHIIDLQFNDANGGSIAVTVSKRPAPTAAAAAVAKVIRQEDADGLSSLMPFRAFEARAKESRQQLRAFVANARSQGKIVAALGASTKGNVLLQYCGFTADDILAVGEVNTDKFGCVTPGTGIPILPEPGNFWSDGLINHCAARGIFRKFFKGAAAFKNFNLVFPLPTLTVTRR